MNNLARMWLSTLPELMLESWASSQIIIELSDLVDISRDEEEIEEGHGCCAYMCDERDNNAENTVLGDVIPSSIIQFGFIYISISI